MKANFITWAALLLLTATSFGISEHGSRLAATCLILGAAALKCAALGWQFLDLRSAHGLWRGGFLFVVIATLGTIAFMAL
jgi:hypothetical protein